MASRQRFRQAAEAWLDRLWYPESGTAPPTPVHRLVLAVATPLEWLFRLAVLLRRLAWRRGWLRAQRAGVPVVVIGNISVGGTGKTPVTACLARLLRDEASLAVGIVTRGHGSRQATARARPVRVTAGSDAREVGDEAVLLARATGCPVVAGRDRVAAARLLAGEVDVVLADDGLQHLRLARDVEIVLVDHRRRLGNERLLPCGPLREPPSRLQEADLLLVTGAPAESLQGAGGPAPGALVGDPPCLAATARLPTEVIPVRGDGPPRPLHAFATTPVHAVAGIANPGRFFSLLRGCGLQVIEHPLPDHAVLSAATLAFDDALPVLMTDKDAVKCREFADERCWAVPLEVRLSEPARRLALERILSLRPKEC